MGNFGPEMTLPGAEWTTFDPNRHDVWWSEKYHHGSSTFYYNGASKWEGDQIVGIEGRYKMSGRRAVGSFRFETSDLMPFQSETCVI